MKRKIFAFSLFMTVILEFPAIRYQADIISNSHIPGKNDANTTSNGNILYWVIGFRYVIFDWHSLMEPYEWWKNE